MIKVTGSGSTEILIDGAGWRAPDANPLVDLKAAKAEYGRLEGVNASVLEIGLADAAILSMNAHYIDILRYSCIRSILRRTRGGLYEMVRGLKVVETDEPLTPEIMQDISDYLAGIEWQYTSDGDRFNIYRMVELSIWTDKCPDIPRVVDILEDIMKKGQQRYYEWYRDPTSEEP